MQWQDYVITVGPALQRYFNNSKTASILFWSTVTFTIIYYFFNKLLYAFLRTSHIHPVRRKLIIRYIWCSCFYAASVSYLLLFHQSFIASSIENIFANFGDILFVKTANCRYNLIAFVLITFHTHSGILDLGFQCDYAQAISHFLFSATLLSLRDCGFDIFSIVLNCLLGLYNLLAINLTLFALFTENQNQIAMRLYGAVKIVAWAFIFLHTLPFKYLVPTVFAVNSSLFLKVSLCLWFASCVWNSPMLQYIYHQIYHTSLQDCAGIDSNMKCVLIKDTDEMEHLRALQIAVMEIRNASKSKNQPRQSRGTASSKAFQTVKCVMLLKRKLKRIRKESCASVDNRNENNAKNESEETTPNDTATEQ